MLIKPVLIILAVVVVLMMVLIFLVPDTRSVTHHMDIKGTIDQVWAVYTDPGSQAGWRDDIKEVVGLTGEKGSRQWTEVSTRGIIIDFRETVFDAPVKYGLAISSEGHFKGDYHAQFEQTEPHLVRVTMTESMTSLGLGSKFVSLIFVPPRQLIEQFANDAQREIDRRSGITSE